MYDRFKKYEDREFCFHLMEKVLASRERSRLIRKGVIVPESRMKPQMMSKVDGKWVADILEIQYEAKKG